MKEKNSGKGAKRENLANEEEEEEEEEEEKRENIEALYERLISGTPCRSMNHF